MKRSIFLALAAFVLGPGVLLGAPLSSHDPVVLNASGMRPDATNAVAPLYMLGKNNALEETVAPCGLSLRPWDGKDYRDYDWVYKPGANISLRAQTAGANGCTRAVVSLWDWLGNLVYTKTYSSFPVDDLITLKPQCHGVWLVTFDVYSGVTADSLKSRLVKSFGTPVDATSARTLWRKKNCYVIGSCFFPDRYYHWGKTWQFDHPPFPHLTPAEGIDRLADLAARCGMSVLRFDSTDKNLDVLNILQRHSIEADLKVYLRPECLVGESLVQTPRALAAWTSDLDRVIDQFLKPGDKRVAWVELGNEPAHHEFWKGTREQYEWLFEYGMKKIHASNPDMPVLQGGTCTPGADLDGLRRTDAAAYIREKKAEDDWYRGFYRDMAPMGNIWAYHEHGDLTADIAAWRTWERSELASDGYKGNFLQTEGGTCAWRPDRESITWAPVLEKIVYSWSCGEKGWLQYDLASEPNPSRYQDGWSIVNPYDFTPKFQYGALAAMTHTMAGCTFERTLFGLALDKTGQIPTQAVLLNHPKGKMIVWFGEHGQSDLQVRSDAKAVTLIDPMGNATQARPGGLATLQFEPYPQYLLLSGATRVETIKL